MELESNKEYHRKAIALFLCFFVAFFYVETVLKPYLESGAKSPASVAQTTPTASTLANASASNSYAANSAASPVAVIQPQGLTAPTTLRAPFPSNAQVAAAGEVSVDTGLTKVKISLLGGRLTEFSLLEYREEFNKDSAKLNLVTHLENAPYPLGVNAGDSNDAWTQYSLESNATLGNSREIKLSSDAPETHLLLAGSLPDGRTIRKRFSFKPQSYLFNVSVELSAPDPTQRRIELEWLRFIANGDASLLDPYNTQTYAWFDGQKAQRLQVSELEAPSSEVGQVSWVGISDKYFASVLLSPQSASGGRISHNDQLYGAHLQGTPTGGEFSVFAGPKSYALLEETGYELRRTVDYGVFGVVAAPLNLLLRFFYRLLHNYGLAIVALTILVRLALYPLNSASFKQMKAMQDLKPEMDRIREQFKDRQEQQMQMMALYKKHGVNPLGGCLPMLIQMPIFLGLYSALSVAVELRHAPFALWILDLSGPEKLMIAGIGIPVMVILFVISMIVQQMMMPTQLDPVQKKVMMVMPVFFGFLFAKMPSGLTLYWLTSNLISIGQQKGLQLAHDDGKSGLKITLSVSAMVMVFAFLVTLF